MPQDSIQITLSDEAVVEFVRGKVRSGAYASEADVVREGISTLQDKEDELEYWLKEVGGPRYDQFLADPTSVLSLKK